MNTKLATRQIRLNEWAAIIKDCKASGQKVDIYCEQHGLSRDAYYYWLRKVKEAALTQAGFVEHQNRYQPKQLKKEPLHLKLR